MTLQPEVFSTASRKAAVLAGVDAIVFRIPSGFAVQVLSVICLRMYVSPLTLIFCATGSLGEGIKVQALKPALAIANSNWEQYFMKALLPKTVQMFGSRPPTRDGLAEWSSRPWALAPWGQGTGVLYRGSRTEARP